jgi:hypothetical protein
LPWKRRICVGEKAAKKRPKENSVGRERKQRRDEREQEERQEQQEERQERKEQRGG